MVNKVSKNYDLQYKDLHLFKKLCISLDIEFKLDNIEKLDYVKIPFYLDIVEDAVYEIDNKFIHCKYEDSGLEFLNNLFWIYLESDIQFVKQIKVFNNLCKNFTKNDYFDPLYPIEQDDGFNNYVIKKLNLSSFGEYRDKFYDKFGIDLVEYYEKIIRKEHDNIRNKYQYSILKNIALNFYPYKDRKILHEISLNKPTHKFIKLYSSYIEISPFLKVNETIDLLKVKLTDIQENLKFISKVFTLFYVNENEKKEEITGSLPGINKGQDILRKSFILIEIIRYHNLKDDIEKAIRLYNFYILKKYNKLICINEDSLYDMLNNSNINNIYGTLKLNKEAEITVIVDGKTRNDIKKFTNILLQNTL